MGGCNYGLLTCFSATLTRNTCHVLKTIVGSANPTLPVQFPHMSVAKRENGNVARETRNQWES